MVTRALRMMDRSSGRVEISLHPKDMELLGPVLAGDPDFSAVSFTSDSALERGDFFLHTENAAIDGRLETRTQRLREQLLGERG
jgi:flagellar biosynthesis/type III secretory pathway protein FliH